VVPPGGAYPFQVDASHCSAIARSQARNRLIVIDAGPCGVKTIQVEWLPR
jgi:hypothetical protein